MRARLTSGSWKFVSNVVIPSPLVPRLLRRELLRWCGVRIHGGVELRQGLDLLTTRLSLGDAVFVNRRVVINNTAEVTLERNVALGPEVLITTSHHLIGDPERRQGTSVSLPVHIGAGTWVGAAAVILPGVTIGPGCVIAAGAVVNRDSEPHGLYGGVPARRLRELDRDPVPVAPHG